MALSLRVSGETSLEHARRASQEIQEGNLHIAEVTLSRAAISAEMHLKEIEYLIERYSAVQDHYKQQESDLAARINSVLERQKSAAEMELKCEESELSIYQIILSSAKADLRYSQTKRKVSGTGKVVMGVAAGLLTVLSFGIAAPVTAPLAAGAVLLLVVLKKMLRMTLRGVMIG